MSTAVAEKPVEAKNPSRPKKYKFKLLTGMYISTEYVKQDDGMGGTVRQPVNTTYQADRRKGVFPIIDADEDLEKYNGQSTNMKKFERVYGEAPVTITDPTERLPGETIHRYLTRMADLGKTMKERVTSILKSLDSLDVPGLQKLADEEEIDLSAAKTPDEARKIIRDALKS